MLCRLLRVLSGSLLNTRVSHGGEILRRLSIGDRRHTNQSKYLFTLGLLEFFFTFLSGFSLEEMTTE